MLFLFVRLSLVDVQIKAINMSSKDVESGKPKQLSHFEQVFDEAGITPEVRAWSYSGSGTEDDPFVVDYIENDPRNPQLYTTFTKWLITLLVAFITLAVAFSSSAFSGGAGEVIRQFGIDREVFTLGISLFGTWGSTVINTTYVAG